MSDDMKNYSEKIQSFVNEIGGETKNIIPLLHKIQEEYHYLPEYALKTLAEITNISPATITGVSTFYSQFRFKPAGKHMIKVCIGTACHVKGAEDIFQNFKSCLGIPTREDTDENKLFTVEKVACLGCCMLAPAVQIGEITYGPVETTSIPGIIKDFLAGSDEVKIDRPALESHNRRQGTLKICLCSSCAAAGSKQVHGEAERIILDRQLPVQLKNVGCTGMSFQCPIIEIETGENEKFKYGLVKKADVEEILSRHFSPSKLIPKVHQKIFTFLNKLYDIEEVGPVTRYVGHVRDESNRDFVQRQEQIATENSGKMDPLDLDEYIANQGSLALEKSLNLSPEEIVETIKQSGLRGRGGAGFNTATKWLHVRSAPGPLKYIVCNADEGDPGAFMDRMLLESFPFRVIEGMAIAARACEIKKGFIFLRAEYSLAISRMRRAIQECREKNSFIGANLELELVVSAGAFVCGEETALISSIQGARGIPRIRPPYPSQQGLWQAPTLVNNVETFALIPWIILHGAEEFAKLGTETSRGTKTFALAGKINNGGLIEVKMGTSLREIIYVIGGGIPDGKQLKAVQIGGPSGGCIPASLLDTPVDYESLKSLGAIMGSGGLIVLDEDDCMVDVAKYFMTFTQSEACGKCTFGRIGTKRMLEILEKCTIGTASKEDLKRLEIVSNQIKKGALCGLCRSAPNPVLTALGYFEHEFLQHTEGRCPALKCKELIVYRITDDCIGCTKCAQRCPTDAIAIKPYQRHNIDQALCVKCDGCRLICPKNAVEKLQKKDFHDRTDN